MTVKVNIVLILPSSLTTTRYYMYIYMYNKVCNRISLSVLMTFGSCLGVNLLPVSLIQPQRFQPSYRTCTVQKGPHVPSNLHESLRNPNFSQTARSNALLQIWTRFLRHVVRHQLQFSTLRLVIKP